MSTYLPHVSFIIFLSLIFLVEGLGVKNGHYIALFLIFVAPMFLFSSQLASEKKYNFPKIPTLLFLGYMLFSIVATIFSRNISNSIEYILLYSSLILVFLYAYNNKNIVKKFLLPIIFALSILYINVSLLVLITESKNILSFIPASAYQFIYSSFGTHNHLGDFLLLPLVVSTYGLFYKRHTSYSLIFIILSFPFFLLSFSRSAYLAFGITTLLIMISYWFHSRKIPLTKITLVVSLYSVLFFFIFMTGAQIKEGSLLSPLHTQIQQTFDLGNKLPIGGREDYFRLSIMTIWENPLVGLGPHNFAYASLLYDDYFQRTSFLSHNFFLEIAAENGLPAVIFLIGAVLAIVYKSKKDIFFFLALVLLINFQTDYTYAFYSLLFLFFILLGIVCPLPSAQKQTHFINHKLLIFLTGGIFIISMIMLYSMIWSHLYV